MLSFSSRLFSSYRCCLSFPLVFLCSPHSRRDQVSGESLGTSTFTEIKYIPLAGKSSKYRYPSAPQTAAAVVSEALGLKRSVFFNDTFLSFKKKIQLTFELPGTCSGVQMSQTGVAGLCQEAPGTYSPSVVKVIHTILNRRISLTPRYASQCRMSSCTDRCQWDTPRPSLAAFQFSAVTVHPTGVISLYGS